MEKKQRRQLSDDQKRVQGEARSVVKIIGLLDGLSDPSLRQVIESAERRRNGPAIAQPPME